MKSTALFQLGGIAILLSAILTGIGRLIYFLPGQPGLMTAPDLWRGIVAGVLFVLGVGALFAWQSQQGGISGLIGYIFLVCATIFFIGSDVIALAVSAEVLSEKQLAQVPSYALSDSIMPWIWVAGLFAFGISIYYAQIFPKYAGVALLLLGLLQPLTGPLSFARPVYAILYVIAWAWLGWKLYSDAGIQSAEQQTARQGAIVHVSH